DRHDRPRARPDRGGRAGAHDRDAEGRPGLAADDRAVRGAAGDTGGQCLLTSVIAVEAGNTVGPAPVKTTAPGRPPHPIKLTQPEPERWRRSPRAPQPSAPTRRPPRSPRPAQAS